MVALTCVRTRTHIYVYKCMVHEWHTPTYMYGIYIYIPPPSTTHIRTHGCTGLLSRGTVDNAQLLINVNLAYPFFSSRGTRAFTCVSNHASPLSATILHPFRYRRLLPHFSTFPSPALFPQWYPLSIPHVLCAAHDSSLVCAHHSSFMLLTTRLFCVAGIRWQETRGTFRIMVPCW
jgi:hypothetical protein